MLTTDEITTSDAAELWAILLTPRQWRLLELCVAWHARVHDDAGQRAEFASLTQVVRNARPVHKVD